MLQLFKSHIQDPHKLREDDLEPTFVDLKNKILRENVYSDTHKKLCTRVEIILGRILTRHERYTVEVESREDPWKITSLFVEIERESWERKLYRPNKELHLPSTKTELLFFLAFFAYYGGIVKNVGLVRSDPLFAVQVIDHLIHEHQYEPAMFLKGLMYKYGLWPEAAPKLAEARTLLTEAASNGVGGAVIELRQFDVHERLNRYAGAPNR